MTRAAAEPNTRRQPAGAFWKPVTALALILLAVGGAGGIWLVSRPDIHTAGFGEREHVQLSDGSTVQLDAGSRIAVRMRGGARRIELLDGEALFDVRPDPSRPFEVTAGNTRIIALGTRFDVRRRGSEVRVVLVQGKVRVEADKPDGRHTWTLAPEQQITPTAAAPVVIAVDTGSATSWTAGRLMFDRTPLTTAIAEVNRYSRTPVELRADGLGRIEVSGVFDTGDADGFVSAVTALYPLRATQEDGAIILHAGPRK